jgi:hypothetical protein
MWVIAIIELLVKSIEDTDEELKKLLEYFLIVKKVSKTTNFQVVKLLDDLHNYSQT